MTSFVIRRCDDDRYYKHRQYGERWVESITKAKRYSRLGDASNAISLMRDYQTLGLKNTEFVVYEMELKLTGRSWKYSPGQTKRPVKLTPVNDRG